MNRARAIEVRTGWWAVASLALAGCGPTFRYGPEAPHRAEAVGLRAELVALQTRPDTRITAHVFGTGPAIARALLGPADSPPCTEGLRERAIVVDGRSMWLRPVEIAGERTVEFVYASPAAHEVLRAPAVLDLSLASPDKGQSCLRIPLTGTSPELAWSRPRHGYAGNQIRGYFPTGSAGGVGAAWQYGWLLGTQLGPARLQWDVGIGTAVCRHQCLGDSTGFLHVSTAPSLHLFAIESGSFGLDLGVGYRLMSATVGTSDDSRTVGLHGPELTVRFAGLAEQGPGLPSGSRVESAGLEVLLADWAWNGPAGPEHEVSWGLGFSFDSGF